MVKIKWNRQAFPEIRSTPKVRAELLRIAESIARASGAGYVAESGQGRTRARAAVITGSARARRDNNRNQTILRNIEAGRP